MSERYQNKRMLFRGHGGKFRKAKMEDVGIGGVCPKCGHLLLWSYDGDPNDASPTPERFGYRCTNCPPEPRP